MVAKQSTLPTELAIKEIVLGPNVREVDAGTIGFKELVADIETHGIVEPLIVRPRRPDEHFPTATPTADEPKGRYVLVAGFRRHAAALEAKLLVVPVRIMDLTDDTASEIQLVENLLRLNLTPMEEALAVHRYSEATGAKPKEISTRLSKSESWVRERLKLLNLIPQLQARLLAGKLELKAAIILSGAPPIVQSLYVSGHRAEYNEYQIAQDVPEQMRVYAQAAKLAEKYKDSKAPRCPECGSPPWEPSYLGQGAVQDARGHSWNPETGKRIKERESLGGYTPRAKAAERQEVDRTEAPFVRTWETPTEILSELLARHGADVVHFEKARRGKGVEVILRIDEAPEELVKLGSVTLHAHHYSDRHYGYAMIHGLDSKQREADLKRLAPFLKEWDADSPPAGRDPGTPKAPDLDLEKLLDGSVDQVAGRVGRGDPEALELMRSAEVEGKCRGGVLDAIDKRLGWGAHTVHYKP